MMKKFWFIPLAALMLAAGCSEKENGEDPEPGPGPGPAPTVSVWDGKSATEPEDLDATAKTATLMRASDLAWLSEESNASVENTYEGWTFTLGIDIDLDDHPWTPIARWTTTNHVVFKGTFDGGGHRIEGLNFDDTYQNNNGLFGVTQGAVIKNLNVSGTVRGKNQFGGICANIQLSTLIENCTFAGRLESKAGEYFCMGGICGMMLPSSKVMGCHSTATIAFGGYGRAGGIVGTTGDKHSGGDESEIRNCSFTGKFEKVSELTNLSYFGGIIGRMIATIISGCKNTADITVDGTETFVGGISGWSDSVFSNDTGLIFGCYNTGAITNRAEKGHTGGLTGYNYAILGGSYNAGVISISPYEEKLTEESKTYHEIYGFTPEAPGFMDCFYAADKPEDPKLNGVFRFTAEQWPSEDPSEDGDFSFHWGIGSDYSKHLYWKNLGTPGTTDYPILWWEEEGE